MERHVFKFQNANIVLKKRISEVFGRLVQMHSPVISNGALKGFEAYYNGSGDEKSLSMHIRQGCFYKSFRRFK